MNIAIAQTKSKKRFSPKDFLLEWGPAKEKEERPEAPRQNWQQMKMIAMMFSAMSNIPEKPKGASKRKWKK